MCMLLSCPHSTQWQNFLWCQWYRIRACFNTGVAASMTLGLLKMACRNFSVACREKRAHGISNLLYSCASWASSIFSRGVGKMSFGAVMCGRKLGLGCCFHEKWGSENGNGLESWTRSDTCCSHPGWGENGFLWGAAPCPPRPLAVTARQAYFLMQQWPLSPRVFCCSGQLPAQPTPQADCICLDSVKTAFFPTA